MDVNLAQEPFGIGLLAYLTFMLVGIIFGVIGFFAFVHIVEATERFWARFKK